MKEAITLIEFLLQSIDDDSELTGEYLLNAQIDTKAKTEELREYIKKKRAEYRLERGRKLKEKLTELKSNLMFKNQGQLNRQELLFAYRNLEGVDEADIKELKQYSAIYLGAIGHPDVTFAVRNGFALNDATVQDAEEIGINSVARVISNGFDAPSTILAKCNAEFLAIYHSVDLIISKGQGNLEGLIHEKDPRIFFLLMVKCEVMAELLNVKKGSFVVFNQNE